MSKTLLQADVAGAESCAFDWAESDRKLRAVCRILRDVRAALDTDPVAARGHVERLAKVLGATGCGGEPRELQRSGLAPWQERRLRDHIAANLRDPLPVFELAALVRLSPSHFARAFRRSFGVSARRFIIEQRIDVAKRLILESVGSIAEIALACGMSDQSHLTRHFTRIVGTSPAAWRRMQMTPSFAQDAGGRARSAP